MQDGVDELATTSLHCSFDPSESALLNPESSWCLRKDSNLLRLVKSQVRCPLRHGGG